MNCILKTLFVCLLILVSTVAQAKLRVITTTTNMAWLAQQIAGEKADITSLISGVEDVHYISAKPNYIHLASNADILCSIGLGLEVGWLPKILERSGNSKIQVGGKGHCVLSEGIDALGKITTKVDRSMGDVHAEGNPHFSLSPDHMIQAGENFLGVLLAIDSSHSDYYMDRYQKTKSELEALRDSIGKEIKEKVGVGVKVLEYHKEFTYFLAAYGLTSIGAMEELPGVPPSAGRIAKIALEAKAQNVRIALAAPYNSPKIVHRVSSIAKIPALTLPVQIRANTEFSTYPELQKYLAAKIIEAISNQ